MIVEYNTTLNYENVNKSTPYLIFKLMFSCCFLSQLDAMFVFMLLQLQMEIKCSPEVRILRGQNSRTLLSLAKRHLKQGGQIVGLIFFYTEILATLI